MSNNLSNDHLGPGEIPPPGFEEVQLISPASPFQVRTPIGDLDLTGCCAIRPIPNGRLLAVEPLLFAQARLCIGRPEMMVMDAPWGGWDDQWEYPTLLAAVAAMALWQPDRAEEPENWTRHQRSGRRRPGGIQLLEYVWK